MIHDVVGNGVTRPEWDDGWHNDSLLGAGIDGSREYREYGEYTELIAKKTEKGLD